uniref:hypothetical protein n=1 Tax=Streptobacillus moniliformis TaxID=34105 RepID=UPI000A707C26
GVDTKGYKIFKKYGKNINANKFLEEYLISKNSISATYDYETNQVKNEAIWIKYLLKEYNRYKFRKRNVICPCPVASLFLLYFVKINIDPYKGLSILLSLFIICCDDAVLKLPIPETSKIQFTKEEHQGV